MKQKPNYSIGQNLGFMLRCAWNSRRSVPFICVGLALVSVGQSLCQLFITPKILQRVETHAPLPELLGTIAVYSLLGFLLSGIYSYGSQNRMSPEIDVRSEVIRLINRKGCTTSFPNTRNPVILKLKDQALHATSSNLEASEHIWQTISEIITNGIGLILYLILLSDLDAGMLLVVLATTVLSFLVSRRANEWEYRHRAEREKTIVEMRYITKISRSNALAKDIRIFGLVNWLRELNGKALGTYEAFIARREKILLFGNLADLILTFARNAIAYGYLISLVLHQGLPASDFLLYFTAVSGLTAWVTGLLSQFSTLHKESLDLCYIREYLDIPEPFRFEEGLPLPQAEGYTLTLQNVTFRYPGSDKPIFENLNLTIHPGENLAIVGLNGAGKTTLVLLLAGFYDPDQGCVLLNGQDIRQFNRREYYRLFSAVFQEHSLLDVTVAQQIAQSVTDIDENRVWQCLRQAGLAEFIQSLPNGLDTHMGREVYLDGILLSGGQTQRMILARALYKDGPILILDEPTAALDPIAENDIYQKYHSMTDGKTSVFISHRLASTRFCDRILYIAGGTIAEEGTHEELLALNGAYAQLFEVQSRYYRKGGIDHGDQ